MRPASFLHDGVVSVAVKVGSAGIALALAVLLARVLGPAQYGVYSYAFALMMILSIPAQFGLPRLVVRETAAALIRERWCSIRGVWRWSFMIATLLSLVLAIAGAGVAWYMGDHLDIDARNTFMWALLLVPLVALANLCAAALRGLRRMLAGLLTEFVLRIGLFISLVAIYLWWGGRGLTAASAMCLHVLAAAIALLVASYWLRRARPRAVIDCREPAYDARRWLHSTMPLALVAGMQVINTRADILLLGFFTDSGQIGVYQVAVSSANLVVLGLSAIGLAVAPRFASLHAQGDSARLQRLVTHSARIVLLLTLPVVLILAFFGGDFVRLVFGAEYAPAYAPLVILAAGQLVNAAFGPVGMLLNMTNHERATARGVMIAAVVNVVLNLLLIPRFGIAGAAMATACSLVLWNVLLWRAARELLAIDSLAFPYSRA